MTINIVLADNLSVVYVLFFCAFILRNLEDGGG